MSFSNIRRAGAVLVALFAAVGAQAETLRVSGIYAPGADIPADIELVVIERFEGDVGQDLEFKLAQLLGDARVGGAEWFDIISPEALDNSVVEIETDDGTIVSEPLVADAQLRGTVRSEVFERQRDPKLQRDCIKRDNEDNCLEYREVRIECFELTVRIDPRLALIDSAGRQLFTRDYPEVETRNYCADDSSIPSILEISDRLVEKIAYTTRSALAPRNYSENVRIMESRSGLVRADRSAFREAVKLTDDDPDAACRAFAALEATNPEHLSVLFNIGLCWEASKQYERASDYYGKALAVDGDHDYPRRGMSRVRSFLRGAAYVEEREGR